MTIPKPSSCDNCALREEGRGFVPPSGPPRGKVLLVGESAGSMEVLRGEPFAGPAGGMLNRVMFFGMLDRSRHRIGNVIQCQPPNDWLDGAPWEAAAVAHCSPNLDALLEEGHQVVVPMGATALRRVLHLPKYRGDEVSVKNFHGYVERDPLDRFWVVPTFHPSYLQRGATNLIGTMIWDLQRAWDVAEHGFTRAPVSLVEDPPPEWVREWIDSYLEAAHQDPEGVALSVDVETPYKIGKNDEGEIKGADDPSYTILRWNLACSTDEGISFPAGEPYDGLVRKALESPGPKLFWNAKYDVDRIVARGWRIRGQVIDGMWAWHVLQSDSPRGLGYVAPFYSDLRPWKHLGSSRPAYYGSMDGVQNHRACFGVFDDLTKMGKWDVYWRQVHELHQYGFTPSERVGLKLSRPRLIEFEAKLRAAQDTLYDEFQEGIPEKARKVHPKGGWTKEPTREQFDRANATRGGKDAPLMLWPPYRQRVVREVQVCLTCDEYPVTVKHKCARGERNVAKQNRPIDRWFSREEFNPGSWQQVLAIIKAKGHSPGRHRKDRNKETTDKKTLRRLMKTGDPFYKRMLEYRDITKTKGTYVDASLARLENSPDDRVHPTVTNAPSTLRTSYVAPNLQNVKTDRESKGVAAGFRKCVIADVGCVLIEADFAGIEAVISGWESGDLDYVRLAKLGMHAYLASHLLKRPADLSWSDEDLVAHFKELKKGEPIIYDRSKRCVHGTNYGLTPYGMVEQFPDVFPKLADARKIQEMYFHLAPKLKAWHDQVRRLADKHHYLETVWGYRHWFWDVLKFTPISEARAAKLEREGEQVVYLHQRPHRIGYGEDAKRAVAFKPQNGNAGCGREAGLRLFKPGESENYIGDLFRGRTPLRAYVHDSFLLEVPKEKKEKAIRALYEEMTRPVKQYPLEPLGGEGFLSIGVEIKVGEDWQDMEVVKLGGPDPGIAADVLKEEEEDEEEAA